MTLTEIHQEIEQTSERRTELWHVLSQGYDPAAAQELKRLSERLDHLCRRMPLAPLLQADVVVHADPGELADRKRQLRDGERDRNRIRRLHGDPEHGADVRAGAHS